MLPVSTNLLLSPAELHLYEGFIGRQEERSLWKTSLQLVGLNKSKAEEVSDDWHLSVKHLLCRIFQKWSPADKLSTDNLCNDLKHFSDSLGSAATRVVYPDRSQPPTIMVGGKKEGFKAFIQLGSGSIKVLFIYRHPS